MKIGPAKHYDSWNRLVEVLLAGGFGHIPKKVKFPHGYVKPHSLTRPGCLLADGST